MNALLILVSVFLTTQKADTPRMTKNIDTDTKNAYKRFSGKTKIMIRSVSPLKILGADNTSSIV